MYAFRNENALCTTKIRKTVHKQINLDCILFNKFLGMDYSDRAVFNCVESNSAYCFGFALLRFVIG